MKHTPHWTASEAEVAAFNKSMAENRLWHMIARNPAENDDTIERRDDEETLTKEELI